MDRQPRLLLVHGSVVNAELTWGAQKPLAGRFEIEAPNRRGFPPGPDVDCAGGSGDGPRYVQGPVQVSGSDPYDLDRDHDGFGCES